MFFIIFATQWQSLEVKVCQPLNSNLHDNLPLPKPKISKRKEIHLRPRNQEISRTPLTLLDVGIDVLLGAQISGCTRSPQGGKYHGAPKSLRVPDTGGK